MFLDIFRVDIYIFIENFKFICWVNFEFGFLMLFCNCWKCELFWDIYLIFRLFDFIDFVVLNVVDFIIMLIENDIKYLLLVMVILFNILFLGEMILE